MAVGTNSRTKLRLFCAHRTFFAWLLKISIELPSDLSGRSNLSQTGFVIPSRRFAYSSGIRGNSHLVAQFMVFLRNQLRSLFLSRTPMLGATTFFYIPYMDALSVWLLSTPRETNSGLSSFQEPQCWVLPESGSYPSTSYSSTDANKSFSPVETTSAAATTTVFLCLGEAREANPLSEPSTSPQWWKTTWFAFLCLASIAVTTPTNGIASDSRQKPDMYAGVGFEDPQGAGAAAA